MANYAAAIASELRGQMVRVSTDFGNNPINFDKSRAGAKIQDAEQLRVHTMLVIGGRDMEAGAVSVRMHGKGNLGRSQKVKLWRRFWRLLTNAEREAFSAQ